MENISRFYRFLILGVFGLSGLLFACNSSPVKEMNKDKTSTPTDSMMNNPLANVDTAYREGASLVAKNDCLSCHKLDIKSVGPAYIDIANKYPMNQGNLENLAHKIIAGGYGRWGTVSMPPHASVTQPEAIEMSRYILSLRKE